MEQMIGITVAEVLEVLEGTQVIAGEAGLGRQVTSVNVMEVPDFGNWVRQGELIFSVLYAIRDDRDARARLITELFNRGAAALAIKPRRYLDAFPSEMLQMANELGFPLLEFKSDASFADGVMPVAGRILNKQAQVLARQSHVHKTLMKAALEGRGLARLTETLAELVENPVSVLDTRGELLAHSPWPAGYDVRRLHQASAVHGDYLLSGGDTLHQQEQVSLDGQQITRVVTPVTAGGKGLGSLYTWELGRPLKEGDLVTLDSASTLVALELVGKQALAEMERRYRDEFLAALFLPEAQTDLTLAARGRTFGWDSTRPYVVLAVRLEEAEALPMTNPSLLLTLQDELYTAVTQAARGCLVGRHGPHLVVLRPADDDQTARKAAELAEAIHKEARPLARQAQVSVGIGDLGSGVVGVQRSYSQAVQAVEIGRRVWGAGQVVPFARLGLYGVLAQLPAGTAVASLTAGVRRLLVYDREHNTELVHTLRVYFACGGNVRRVSEQLFTHYNTVLYRLERIAAIAGVDLEDPDARLNLQVGLQALQLSGEIPPVALPRGSA